MDNINSIVAKNLKMLREQRKLSLDAVAKLSGVSKSMLGQIERSEVSPTISTVWKIAHGLKLSFTELMSRPETDHEIMDTTNLKPLIEDDGRYRAFPVFPFDTSRRFEIYYIEIDSGGVLEAEPHTEGAQEFVSVFSGALTVSVNGERFRIKDGSSFRFRADFTHRYENDGDDMCRISMVISYKQA